MAKNRRLTEASVWRYMQKRMQLNLTLLGKDELVPLLAGNKGAVDVAVKSAYYETQNWAVDQALYHQVRAVVKQIADNYHIPTRWQALLMAYGEKVVANFLVDPKGESLPNIQWEYTRKLMTYTANKSNTEAMGYLRYKGENISIPTLLKDIAIKVGELMGVSSSRLGGYLTGTNLHVTG